MTKKQINRISLVLSLLFVGFIILSFINPTVSRSEKRKECQDKEISYPDDQEYCITFDKEQKLLSSDYTLEVITKEGENSKYSIDGGIFDSEDKSTDEIIDSISVEWTEDGIKLFFDERQTTIPVSAFVEGE